MEGFPGSISKVPWNTLAGQPGKQNHNVRIIRNEVAVKISKAEKRLNVFNLAGFRPILNSLNLGGIHLQSFFREDEAEVFDSVFGKMTFIWTAYRPFSWRQQRTSQTCFL